MNTVIRYKNNIFAYIIKISNKNGVNFYTPKDVTQQVGILNHKKGHLINPHIHLKNPRKVIYTTEVLIILEGKVRVDFFDKQKKYLFSKILNKNNIIIFVDGGHGFKILQNAKIIEVKQGPYNEVKDKVIFSKKIKKKIIK